MPANFSNTLTQNAYVVRDIKQSMQQWHDVFGIGPFILLPHIPLTNVTYRGAPAELDISAAIAMSGNIQIELIEQHNTAKSAYRDTVPESQEGFHHICVWVPDYDGEVKKYTDRGFKIATEGQVEGSNTRFCYIDTRSALNCMMEVVLSPDGGSPLNAVLKEAEANWDGKQLYVEASLSPDQETP